MPRKKKPKQTDIPGTEQQKDDILEEAWLDRVAALESEKSAKEAKADADARIELRFAALAEADPTDPRAHAYKCEDGTTLEPRRKMKIKITRPKAKVDEAAERIRGAQPGDVPDLPDEDYGHPDAH